MSADTIMKMTTMRLHWASPWILALGFAIIAAENRIAASPSFVPSSFYYHSLYYLHLLRFTMVYFAAQVERNRRRRAEKRESALFRSWPLPRPFFATMPKLATHR